MGAGSDIDFLGAGELPDRPLSSISNPPFNVAEIYAAHA
jgi:hypothetical protein